MAVTNHVEGSLFTNKSILRPNRRRNNFSLANPKIYKYIWIVIQKGGYYVRSSNDDKGYSLAFF
jgi:hypothetical protein